MTSLRFGLHLPTFASPGRRLVPGALARLAARAEDSELDSVWFLDHFLKSAIYGQSWLDPLASVAFTAAHTQRLELGTCVLVAPLRNPVRLAHEAATLQHLSHGRFVLGLGIGSNPHEFDSVGVPFSERGSRTDETVAVLRTLLAGGTGSYEGRHYRFSDVEVHPETEVPVPLWIGGGTQPRLEGSSEYLHKGEAMRQRVPERVVQRIATGDGWCAPPHSTPELLEDDWSRISAEVSSRGRPLDAFTFAQQGYFHIARSDDRERAFEEQQQAFERYLGTKRPWSFARETYLVGTVGDIVSRLRDRTRVGCRYHVLSPVVADEDEFVRQMDLLNGEVIPAVREAVAAS